MVATFENLCKLGYCTVGVDVFGNGAGHSLEMAQREARRPGTFEVGNLRGPRMARPVQADDAPILVPYLLLPFGPG